MSRRLPSSSSQRPRAYQPTTDNPYQATTLTIPLALPHTYGQQHHQNAFHYATAKDYGGSSGGGNSLRRHPTNLTGIYDTEVSDDTNTYYEYNPYYNSKNTDCIYSEDETTRISYYECREASPSKRYSRTDIPGHQGNFNGKKGGGFPRDAKFNSSVVRNKDLRKVYPGYEVTQRSSSEATTAVQPTSLSNHRIAVSRLSDRPQSSLSSGMTSAVVDGCGGHCQTFENACYYFMQVAFTMGILIGTSLSIAGAVLRKSAARNLQVLVYIGALLSMVSALLLAIQCSARYSARKRKKALRNAKRAPIPLDTLQSSRPIVVLQQQQPLMGDHNQRGLQLQVPMSRNDHIQKLGQIEQQGIPWWRRKDLD